MAARLGTERADADQRARMLAILSGMMAPEIEDGDRAELVAQLGDCFVEASGNMVLRLMQRGLRMRSSRSAGALRLLSDPPNQVDVDAHLATLARAIEEADGATASEAVYTLSCLFRQKVREQSDESASHAELQRTQSGARS